MAEIHFETMARLLEFASSEQGQLARASAQDVSTGGPPIVLVCERYAEEFGCVAVDSNG